VPSEPAALGTPGGYQPESRSRGSATPATSSTIRFEALPLPRVEQTTGAALHRDPVPLGVAPREGLPRRGSDRTHRQPRPPATASRARPPRLPVPQPRSSTECGRCLASALRAARNRRTVGRRRRNTSVRWRPRPPRCRRVFCPGRRSCPRPLRRGWRGSVRFRFHPRQLCSPGIRAASMRDQRTPAAPLSNASAPTRPDTPPLVQPGSSYRRMQASLEADRALVEMVARKTALCAATAPFKPVYGSRLPVGLAEKAPGALFASGSRMPPGRREKWWRPFG